MVELALEVHLSKSSRWAAQCPTMEGSILAEIPGLLEDSPKAGRRRLRCGMIFSGIPVTRLPSYMVNPSNGWKKG